MSAVPSRAASRQAGLRLRDVGVTPVFVATLVVLTAASQMAFLAFLLVMKHLSDGVLDTRNTATAIGFAALFTLVVGLSGWYAHIRTALLGAIAERLGLTLRAEALQAAVRNAVRTDTAQGATVLREISKVQAFFASRAALLFLELIGALVSILVMFTLDTGLGLIGVGGAAVMAGLGVLLHYASRSRLRDSALAMEETETELSAQLSHPDLVRGLGLVPATLSRWQHRYSAALAAEEATHSRTEALHEIETLASDLLNMGAFLYVGVLLFDGSATAGMLISVYFLMGNALHPFSQLMNSWENWAGGVAAWGRLRRVMRQDAAPEPLPRDPAAPAGLLLDGVAFHPSGRPAPIIGGIALHLPPGAVCTVQGANGVGKSTLLRLAARPAAAERGSGAAGRAGQPLHCERESLRRPHRLPAAGRAAAGYRCLQQYRSRPGCGAGGGGGGGPGRRGACDDRPPAARLPDPGRADLRPLGRATPAGRPGAGAVRRALRCWCWTSRKSASTAPPAPSCARRWNACRQRGGVVLVVTHEPQTWADVADIRLILGPDGRWRTQALHPDAASPMPPHGDRPCSNWLNAAGPSRSPPRSRALRWRRSWKRRSARRRWRS